ncbi:hypothetical cell division FtsK/SpoIIIE protein [Cellulomonas algicola]|uniref:Hypothetical cell division FtsK/SpoIIIE protein n=1 Tax=Cellulomonas algicola TaxID=2071633 RepID=A0A401V0X8_9CELL|nr:FtsK/SpoIIIE domain-containing protein [Cellulomonas algicola]GCD20560.1 hypothetical cell division FtsK/SpoIIIE protein [Cellulomonas algicola]
MDTALRIVWLVLRRVARVFRDAASWTVQSWRAALICLVIGNVLLIADHEAAGEAAMWCVLAWNAARAVWRAVSPLTYEAALGGPLRRRGWRRRGRKGWSMVAERCGLGMRSERPKSPTVVPRLLKVTTTSNALVLQVRVTAGQTVDDVDQVADAIATAFGAESVESRRVRSGVAELVLTMRELLHQITTAPVPHDIETEAVTLGRVSNGSPWRLELNGRHTLVVGRSGAGKGSIFWGVAGNLAPASRAALVRLWGIDLKGGVEVAVGAGMFSSVAMDEQAAVRLLRALQRVIVERQAAMRGRSRQFEAGPGDPIHVLLIDELAVLTAYASRDVVNEASTLLKRILAQGRALGVIVVAFVQDPRKETVGMRELFTQTIALRLASSAETRMVLGDGYGDLAPAHRIERTMAGAGYVVKDDGAVERVRADYWPDDVIRMVAQVYPAPQVPIDGDDGAVMDALQPAKAPDPVEPRPRRQRSPRSPRPAKDTEVA